MADIPQLLLKVEQWNGSIAELLKGEYKAEPRLCLTIAHLNLALDHHSSIILLMRNGRFGSALALVRVTFEAMIRAFWVAKCASDDQATEVGKNDAFRFPKMEVMTEAVDQATSDPKDPDAFFHQAMEDCWKATNSYTHSGLLQLARQISNGRVEAKYPERTSSAA